PPTIAATTAATASSPNASVAVTTSATPSSAAKTSHTIHDPMVTPGAGAAATSPCRQTYTAHPRPYIDSNSATARTSTMTDLAADPPWCWFAGPTCPTRLRAQKG